MRYPRHAVDAKGWTDWLKPRMAGYRLACCDCALVHELVFRVVKRGRGHVVVYKAKRNERATAAMRRKRQSGNRTA